MRYTRLALLVGLALTASAPAQSQSAPPVTAIPARFESWHATLPREPLAQSSLARFSASASPGRTRRALLGGAIGAAAGVVFCTAVSTLANDSADGGLSFCPLDSYFLIGGAGFVVGAVVGWAI